VEPAPTQPLASALSSELVDLLAEQARNAPPAPDGDAARLRLVRAMLDGALAQRGPVAGLPNGVATREIALAPGLAARAYLADGVDAGAPLMVYFHGGGWVAGSLDSVDPFCRLFAQAAGIHILSVDYRLAPEHPYPAALDDGAVALRWARDHAATVGGAADRIVLGGDSAGANLAAVLANRACADGGPDWLRAVLLSCPVTDRPGSVHASYRDNAHGYGLEASLMRWFWRQYAPKAAADDTDLAPLRLARVPPLPPTLVTTAGYDVLRDEGVAYARKLAEAGVDVAHQHAPDMNHNFAVTPGTVARFPQSVAALEDMAGWLRATLAD
jgi:acetyl esterase